MPDREKYIEILSKTAKTVKEFNEDTPIKISLECIEDILELLKEQEHLLTEYEKLSKALFKIEKYFKISDFSRLVDGIENGKIIVLQDNGHFIGGTPFTETTIKIRRL